MVLGVTHIDVADQELSTGYQEGYQRFTDHYCGKPLTDDGVYGFLARNIYDCMTTDGYRAGYILGWCAALHSQGLARPTVGYVVVFAATQPQQKVTA